jgi:hypothetical protein
MSTKPIPRTPAPFNGKPTKAGAILPKNGVDPYPGIDRGIRALVARCLYQNRNDRPSLREAMDIAIAGVQKAPNAFPNPRQETNSAIRVFWQEFLYDAPQVRM